MGTGGVWVEAGYMPLHWRWDGEACAGGMRRAGGAADQGA